LARFNDVGEGAFKEPIELLATLGTISEDGDGFFNGKRSVTRAELADALVKIKKYQLPSSVAGVWENLDTVVNDGLIKGYPDGKYKTTKEVTNAQLAVVLARLEFGSDFRNETRSKHWADNAVNQLASAARQIQQHAPGREARGVGVGMKPLRLFNGPRYETIVGSIQTMVMSADERIEIVRRTTDIQALQDARDLVQTTVRNAIDRRLRQLAKEKAS
jgi:hypothetical protein